MRDRMVLNTNRQLQCAQILYRNTYVCVCVCFCMFYVSLCKQTFAVVQMV